MYCTLRLSPHSEGCPNSDPCDFQVAQTFYITIRPVDDSLPLVQNPGMRVQEGVRKTITEFELKATDADTEVSSDRRSSLTSVLGLGMKPLS